jgi:hypothetical protein
MVLRRALAGGVLAVLALLTGCQPLRVEKTYDIQSGGVQTLQIDAPRYEQKLKVEITSSSPVSAYMVKAADQDAAEKALLTYKAPESSLAGVDRSDNITFEATVPAKTEPALLIHNATGKTVHVQVKITGR